MKARGRPKKYRFVGINPPISQFSPRGKPGRPDEANLSTDEFEAIRLADQKGLSQKEASRSMHVSQQTFSRILRKARKNIADALVTGKIIRIQGGYYVVSSRQNNPQEEVKEQPINPQKNRKDIPVNSPKA
ncbi:MAG: DUF134 domain-containing protein [Candidatus Omnitrophica bacterium]|nr:DUF134 domain-containing protein [Candidatus Omnitrophota bacterium]